MSDAPPRYRIDAHAGGMEIIQASPSMEEFFAMHPDKLIIRSSFATYHEAEQFLADIERYIGHLFLRGQLATLMVKPSR